MGQKSNNPEKYWRAGIAMPVERKPVFEARLKELGMATIGDLASFVALGDGVIEALKPIMPAWHANSAAALKGESAKRKELLDKVKHLSPDELDALLKRLAPVVEQDMATQAGETQE